MFSSETSKTECYYLILVVVYYWLFETKSLKLAVKINSNINQTWITQTPIVSTLHKNVTECDFKHSDGSERLCSCTTPSAHLFHQGEELLDCTDLFFFSICFLSTSIHVLFISDSYKTDFEFNMWQKWSAPIHSIWTQEVWLDNHQIREKSMKSRGSDERFSLLSWRLSINT